MVILTMMMMKKSGDRPPSPVSRPFLPSSRHNPVRAHSSASFDHHRILDPGSEIVLQWNRIFLISCIVALFIDPLYFYLPSFIQDSSCLHTDLGLGIAVTVFRSFADLFYFAHVVMKFRTAFVSPSSRVFGRGELVMDERQIATRYLKSDFLIDLAAMLPLPQMLIPLGVTRRLHATDQKDLQIGFVIWCIIPAVKSASANYTNNTLSLIVLIQYIPRLFLIFPLTGRIVKTTGAVTKTAWAGAAYNMILYMLASHLLGACWYLLSLGRQHTCWKIECVKEDGSMHMPICDPSFLECASLEQSERKSWLNRTHVFSNCDATNINISFKYGMFADALTNNVVSSTFMRKFLYCLWWGLRNLSSYGQTLETSTFVGETSFCILICIMGLVIFAHLMGNMQTYLQSITMRIEEWRIRRRDTEEWMRHRQLPPDLQERIRRFGMYRWLATRGVDEESILLSLPLDLRRDIQRHLCLALVRRVPFFSQMDDQLLDAICERLVSSLSTPYSYIVREGDPVNEMFFIIRGQLESSTTNGGRSGFFNSITLRPGDFCGEELLTWALMPNSTLNLPSSTRTVRSLTEVEAFALRAEDLKFVAHQFKRLHSKKLQHAFRYYSHQWRTWGACFIQAAWRRFKKRKLAKELEMQESLFYNPLLDSSQSNSYEYHDVPLDEYAGDSAIDNQSNFQHLNATILASKFAKNTKRGVNQKRSGPTSSSLKMPKLLKPDEPDFSLHPEDDD